MINAAWIEFSWYIVLRYIDNLLHGKKCAFNNLNLGPTCQTDTIVWNQFCWYIVRYSMILGVCKGEPKHMIIILPILCYLYCELSFFSLKVFLALCLHSPDCNVLNFSLLHCNLYANQPLMSILANPIQKETNLVATEQIQEMKDANILSAGL